MTVLTDAYVLKKSLRGDFDRQFTLYTRELGKISCLAKGAAKITSKLSSHLDFFYLIEVMVAPGQAFYRLAGAKIRTAYLKNNSDLSLTAIANIFLEAIDIMLVEKYPDAAIFSLVDNFFNQLDRVEDLQSSQLLLNQTLYELMSRLGYQPKITARSQSQLTGELCRHIMETGEKELKFFPFLNQQFNCF